MAAEAMPPGRNWLPRGAAGLMNASGAVAEPACWKPKAFVRPWTLAAAGTALPGSWAIGGIPPDDWIHTEPIQRGGMSGTVRRSSTATPKAGAVRMTWTGPPGTPRVGSSVNTIGCGEFVMFIADRTVFHSVAGFQFLKAIPMVLALPGAMKLCASSSAGMPAEIANDWWSPTRYSAMPSRFVRVYAPGGDWPGAGPIGGAEVNTSADPKKPAGGAIATEAAGLRSIESPAPQSAVPTPPTANVLEHQKMLASVRAAPVFMTLMRVVSTGTP